MDVTVNWKAVKLQASNKEWWLLVPGMFYTYSIVRCGAYISIFALRSAGR